MASKPDTSSYERFSEVTDRLDEIIAQVRDKETSLERSLDLFDEAIALGTRAVDLVDKAAFSPEEKERLVAAPDEAENADEGDAAAEANAEDVREADVADGVDAKAQVEDESEASKDEA